MKNDKTELNEAGLEEVNGGTFDYDILNPSRRAGSHDLPKVEPYEKYVMDAAPPAADIISELKS